jgi:uncharacterized protein (DUF433 family)
MLQPSARVFQEVLHRVLKAAGLEHRDGRPDIRFRDLRHTFASHWVMNGGDIYRLKQVSDCPAVPTLVKACCPGTQIKTQRIASRKCLSPQRKTSRLSSPLAHTPARRYYHSMRSPVWSDPERMGGTLCFQGTRVPAQTLLDYLDDGSTLEEFFECFPGVTREDAAAFLKLARGIDATAA